MYVYMYVCIYLSLSPSLSIYIYIYTYVYLGGRRRSTTGASHRVPAALSRAVAACCGDAHGVRRSYVCVYIYIYIYIFNKT